MFLRHGNRWQQLDYRLILAYTPKPWSRIRSTTRRCSTLYSSPSHVAVSCRWKKRWNDEMSRDDSMLRKPMTSDPESSPRTICSHHVFALFGDVYPSFSSSSSSCPLLPFSYMLTCCRRNHFGVVIVPQQNAVLVERFGKFRNLLDSGIHFLIPIVDRVSYRHTLKEEAIPITNQTAITKDNVSIHVDGVLYVRVSNPYDASYGVENYRYAITQLAQTTMRSELGKLTLDNTLSERESLNHNIVQAINAAAQAWGVTCLRYEIRDIVPPQNIRAAMEKQSEAERRKRAEILQSEGEKQSEINIATGKREAKILEAQGTAQALQMVGSSIREEGGEEAATLQIAQRYLEAFSNLAKTGNSVIIPASISDPGAMISTALAVYKGASQTFHKVDDASETKL